MSIVEPRLQAGGVEKVSTREPVHHRLRVKAGEADPAVRGRGATEPQRGPEPHRAGLAAEPVGEAGLRRPRSGERRLWPRRGAEAEEVEGGAEELLQDGDGDGGVDENESEHALGWGRQAGEPHVRRIAGSHGQISVPKASSLFRSATGEHSIRFELSLDFLPKDGIFSRTKCRLIQNPTYIPTKSVKKGRRI